MPISNKFQWHHRGICSKNSSVRCKKWSDQFYTYELNDDVSKSLLAVSWCCIVLWGFGAGLQNHEVKWSQTEAEGPNTESAKKGLRKEEVAHSTLCMPTIWKKEENLKGVSQRSSLSRLLCELCSRVRNAWRCCSQKLCNSRADQISILLNASVLIVLIFVSKIAS